MALTTLTLEETQHEPSDTKTEVEINTDLGIRTKATVRLSVLMSTLSAYFTLFLKEARLISRPTTDVSTMPDTNVT